MVYQCISIVNRFCFKIDVVLLKWIKIHKMMSYMHQPLEYGYSRVLINVREVTIRKDGIIHNINISDMHNSIPHRVAKESKYHV